MQKLLNVLFVLNFQLIFENIFLQVYCKILFVAYFMKGKIMPLPHLSPFCNSHEELSAYNERYPREDAIRNAVAELVHANKCWGRQPITKMVFTQISPSPALHYIVETYTESREVSEII